MGEVKLKIDWYTKLILTLIVIALFGIFCRLTFTPNPVQAGGAKIQDVNIARIDGKYPDLARPIPVKVIR